MHAYSYNTMPLEAVLVHVLGHAKALILHIVLDSTFEYIFFYHFFLTSFFIQNFFPLTAPFYLNPYDNGR